MDHLMFPNIQRGNGWTYPFETGDLEYQVYRSPFDFCPLRSCRDKSTHIPGERIHTTLSPFLELDSIQMYCNVIPLDFFQGKFFTIFFKNHFQNAQGYWFVLNSFHRGFLREITCSKCFSAFRSHGCGLDRCLLLGAFAEQQWLHHQPYGHLTKTALTIGGCRYFWAQDFFTSETFQSKFVGAEDRPFWVPETGNVHFSTANF